MEKLSSSSIRHKTRLQSVFTKALKLETFVKVKEKFAVKQVQLKGDCKDMG